MRDIVFSVKQQKREINILLACIILAYLLNLISIVVFSTKWSELWTESLWVLILTGGLYGLSIVLRLFWYGGRRLISKK